MKFNFTPGDKIHIPEISTSPLTVVSVNEGGFGRVIEVDECSGDKSALKILKWELGLNSIDLVKEAEKLADLANHPNITEVYGLYKLQGKPCIAMRYYPSTLAIEMKNKLSSSRILEILMQITSGLSYLHNEVGLLHLDIKPQNILIDKDKSISISDFGISKVLPKPTNNGITKNLFMSGITGTIAYMSPEQLTTYKVSPKTDIFSLGTMLFEVLTGRHPFLSNSYEQTAKNILTITPSFNNREKILISSHLRNICLACINKNPSHRPTAKVILKTISKDSSHKSLTYSKPQIDSVRLINKASTLAKVGRLDEAILILEELIESKPFNLTAVVNLAEFYYFSGDIEKAVESAENALGISKWHPVNQDSLATLLTNISYYYLSIDLKKSIYYANFAVEIDPNDWQALGNKAEACRVLGDSKNNNDLLNDGLESCLKAMKLNPNDLKLKVTYGGILLALKDFKTLSPYIVNLINKYGGDDVPLRLLLIRTLIGTGQLKSAEEWLNPMRKYKELKGIVSIADRELRKRKNSLPDSM